MTGLTSPGEGFAFSQRRLTQLLCRLICATAVFQPFGALAQSSAGEQSRPNIVTVSIRRGHPSNRFIPSHAFGAGIDGHDKGEADRQLRPVNIREMLSAGLKSLTYRLRTELAIDAWHWNPKGIWSDAAYKQGYWISDNKSDEPIFASYGYRLPRRGNTIDQGNNDGYSRLDDGDTESFWKSNPYLDEHFTHEKNWLHPQWIVIEFDKPKLINAARLLWGTPYAKAYRLQYADFGDISDIALNPPGMWRDFPRGVFPSAADPLSASAARGGEVFLRLVATPIKTRFVRILMTRSSDTAPSGSTDVRDGLGFAMREIYLGQVNQKGEFVDEIQHGTNRHTQTIMHVSSTDPWHRENDLDDGVEQPGFDRIFQSGLTNDLPVLLPTGIFYDTPENAANEIRYLRARGYKFDRVELGEEPDGQYAAPEDFGALYLQWAEAIHGVDPHLQIGGPSFQEIQPGDEPPAERRGNSAWLQRFRSYLRAHGREKDYSFFSFEWYPFDDVCQPVAPQLARATNMLTAALQEMQRRGLSRRLPWIISEYGYSAFGARAEISIEGALLNADIVGRFLTMGGEQAFLYGYTPSEVLHDNPCSAGQNMLFSMDEDGDITHRYATYFGARLLTQEWTLPAGGWHEIYPAVSNVRNEKGESIVTAYAVHRPDGLWALLLINKEPARSYEVQIRFLNEITRAVSAFTGPVDLYQFSNAQYELNDDQKDPHPIKADPPAHKLVQSDQTSSFELPAYSLTVIRGAGPTLERKERKRR
jgi:F5/8 type C domain